MSVMGQHRMVGVWRRDSGQRYLWQGRAEFEKGFPGEVRLEDKILKQVYSTQQQGNKEDPIGKVDLFLIFPGTV